MSKRAKWGIQTTGSVPSAFYRRAVQAPFAGPVNGYIERMEPAVRGRARPKYAKAAHGATPVAAHAHRRVRIAVEAVPGGLVRVDEAAIGYKRK